MTLLDDLRELSHNDELEEMCRCRVQHLSACPSLLVPRLVAALEMVDRLLTEHVPHHPLYSLPGCEVFICDFCHHDTIRHDESCLWQVLTKAVGE